MQHKPGKKVVFIALLCVLTWVPVRAQTQGPIQTPATPTPADQSELIDRVVAVVNGDLILESDIDEERRFEAFQPFTHMGQPFSRDEAIARLIDRTLILQQARIQPGDAVTDDEVDKQLVQLRKDIPACAKFHCDTDGGWQKFVEAQGFTVAEIHNRWRERMTVLKFIEMRFRMGIRISPDQINDYYTKTLIPQYLKQKATAPKLDGITDRIQEILLQEQVSNLLDEWLKSLKAQGSVRMMKPDGGAA